METTQYSNKILELIMASAHRVVAKEFLTRCLLVILLQQIQARENVHKLFDVGYKHLWINLITETNNIWKIYYKHRSPCLQGSIMP